MRVHHLPFLVGLLFLTLSVSAACPPAVANFAVSSSICGGAIRLSFTPPAGQLVFPQILRADIPVLSLAAVVGTGTLNASSFDDTPPSSDIAYFYWVRWQGLDSACPLGPEAGPLSGITMSPTVAAGGALIPRPQISANCTSVTLRWTNYRETTAISVMRGPNPNLLAPVATLSPTANTFIDPTGAPGGRYFYAIAYATPCGTISTLQTETFFPPFASIPAVTSADVLAGSNAAISASIPTLIPGLSIPPRWFRDNVQVANVPGHISGADTLTLQFTNARPEDQGIYTLRLDTSCGQITPISASLIVRPACAADFNVDAHLGVDDIFAFLSAWFAGCP